MASAGLVLFAALIWAWISRMCGGGWPKLPFGLDQWIYAIPHGVLGFVALGWWGLLAYPVAILGKRTGHGQWFDMGTSPAHNDQTGLKPEKLDFIVKWFMGTDDGSYRRDFVGMAVSGFFIAIGSVVALFASGHPLLAILVTVGGLCKPVGYALGQWVAPRWGGEHNEYGEFIAGFIDTLCVGIAIWALTAS